MQNNQSSADNQPNRACPRHETRFARLSSCSSFWSWFYWEWNFVNTHFEREVGVRFLGVEMVGFYPIPMGELRF